MVQSARHIEVQVAGDAEGNAVHVLERDCSMQRRQQKIIEEATASSLDSALRDRICGAARDRHLGPPDIPYLTSHFVYGDGRRLAGEWP